jgi:hypothetical protein
MDSRDFLKVIKIPLLTIGSLQKPFNPFNPFTKNFLDDTSLPELVGIFPKEGGFGQDVSPMI